MEALKNIVQFPLKEFDEIDNLKSQIHYWGMRTSLVTWYEVLKTLEKEQPWNHDAIGLAKVMKSTLERQMDEWTRFNIKDDVKTYPKD